MFDERFPFPEREFTGQLECVPGDLPVPAFQMMGPGKIMIFPIRALINGVGKAFTPVTSHLRRLCQFRLMMSTSDKQKAKQEETMQPEMQTGAVRFFHAAENEG
ncbi:MAG: hypothetical protein JWL59_2240 [Chthoniobacteraceae bacterium]|nr:hypothetical protein [Chthoniobacteraceae bacterium]